MKVIAVSNFADEMVSDVLVAEHLSQSVAEAVAEELNSHVDDFSPRWHRVVPEDHKLYRFEP